MAYYLVRYGGVLYANDELFCAAVAGSEQRFRKMLVRRETDGFDVLGHTLYTLTEEQSALCGPYAPIQQDIDDQCDALTPLDPELLWKLEEKNRVIRTDRRLVPNTWTYRGLTFFKLRDFSDPNKYRLLPLLPVVRVCGGWYVACNAVLTREAEPYAVLIA